MQSNSAIYLVVLLAVSGCALPWGKPEEPPVPGTHISSKIHGFTAVIPEGWVPLESSPFSFPDPDPFPGQSDRRIYVRPDPRAVLAVDVMLTPSDGRTVLPDNADLAKVRDLLAAVLFANRGAADPAPRITVVTGEVRYDYFRRSHTGERNRYIGLVRQRGEGGFVVAAMVGGMQDPSLEADLAKVREHLKVD